MFCRLINSPWRLRWLRMMDCKRVILKSFGNPSPHGSVSDLVGRKLIALLPFQRLLHTVIRKGKSEESRVWRACICNQDNAKNVTELVPLIFILISL